MGGGGRGRAGGGCLFLVQGLCFMAKVPWLGRLRCDTERHHKM